MIEAQSQVQAGNTPLPAGGRNWGNGGGPQVRQYARLESARRVGFNGDGETRRRTKSSPGR